MIIYREISKTGNLNKNKLQKIKLKLESHSSYEKYNRVIQVRMYSKTKFQCRRLFPLGFKSFRIVSLLFQRPRFR